MKHRIALWGVAGLVVAAGWAWVAMVTTPWTGSRAFWIVVDITCPVALWRAHPLSLPFVLVTNALTYAVFGFGFELLRPKHASGVSR